MLTNKTDNSSELPTEITITHSKRRRLTEVLIFCFWTAVGIFLILLGALSQAQSLVFQIGMIIFGSIIIVAFLESCLVVFTSILIINDKGIKLKTYFSWTHLLWKNINNISIEKQSSGFLRKGEIKPIVVTFTKINGDEIHYPIHRFKTEKTNQIVTIISKKYQNACDNYSIEIIRHDSENQVDLEEK
jgi:hypothetical protein